MVALGIIDVAEGSNTIQQYSSKQSIVLSNRRDVFKIVYSSDLMTLLKLSQLRLDFLPIITFFEMPVHRSMTAYRYSGRFKHLKENMGVANTEEVDISSRFV